MVRLQSSDERDVGICEYVTPRIGGIGGRLKRHASDFVVQEINLSNEPVALGESDSPDEADDSADEDDPPPFTRFVLRKERMDTLAAVASLSQQLKVPVRSFGFAGLKDHRAVTVQEMTVRGVTPSALRACHHPNFKIGKVRRTTEKLKLGALGGNRFKIIMRGVHGDVDAALGALRKRGFVNYYGQQRFGDSPARNDEVGRRLLLGEYSGAVDALLGPAEAHAGPQGHSVSGAEAEARSAWLHSGDARTALKLMPRGRTLEREVLTNLARTAHVPTMAPNGHSTSGGIDGCSSLGCGLSHDDRCRIAILGLPLGVRRLLVHSYFSKIYNAVASERLRKHGLSHARQGELVISRSKLLRGRGGVVARRNAVHMVTAEEEESKAYKARQIVLPLPGSEVKLPETPEGTFYAQALRFDGIDPFAPAIERGATRRDPESNAVEMAPMDDDGNWFVLPGDYRALLLRPRNMSWEMLPEEDEGEQQQSDNERSVALKFDLPPGAYATMALREASKERAPASRVGHIRFA